MLQTAFSEIFSLDEWLKVWDHILCNHPRFMLMLAVAYLRQQHSALMSVDEEKDFRVSLTAPFRLCASMRVVCSRPHEPNQYQYAHW